MGLASGWRLRTWPWPHSSAAGDPAAELAARALAMNGGSLARALVGLAQALLDRERYVSRELLRGS